jgi:hypothetical protein
VNRVKHERKPIYEQRNLVSVTSLSSRHSCLAAIPTHNLAFWGQCRDEIRELRNLKIVRFIPFSCVFFRDVVNRFAYFFERSTKTGSGRLNVLSTLFSKQLKYRYLARIEEELIRSQATLKKILQMKS